MQKNRRQIRKVIQEPNAVDHRTNIQRRNVIKAPVRTTNNQAIAANVSKTMNLRNVAQPSTGRVDYSVVNRLYPGETIYIPLGAVHRIENPFKKPVKIIEAQIGSILKETDIVRYQDVYGRVL